MAEVSLAITTEYVRNFLALMGRDFFWPESVRIKLASLKLDSLDITHVLTHGEVIQTEKETADGTTMVIVGATCDDVQIRVKFWADPNLLTIRILDVVKF